MSRDAQISSIQSEFSALSHDHQSNVEMLESKNHEVNDLHLKMSQLELEMAQLQLSLQPLEAKLSEKTEVIETLLETNKCLETEVKAYQDDIARVSKNEKELKDELAMCHAAYSDLQTVLSKMETPHLVCMLEIDFKCRWSLTFYFSLVECTSRRH